MGHLVRLVTESSVCVSDGINIASTDCFLPSSHGGVKHSTGDVVNTVVLPFRGTRRVLDLSRGLLYKLEMSNHYAAHPKLT